MTDKECRACDEGDPEECAYVIDKLAKLLAGVAIALKGAELPRHRHSYHDLPELAKVLKVELDIYRSNAASLPANERVRDEAYERAAKVCEAQYDFGDGDRDMKGVRQRHGFVLRDCAAAIRALIGKGE